ncbi:hypothetical protein [Clostridium felsineum]|uniref:hypothetical protein n=1 Tax=Clostridium felsineum TaxID=36839 RepID=UPI00098C1864|nr:hypothetical protein [Clostridium felsineum]URZ01021.1 hypothetical protein CLAUR_010090 [Clostridium felsineum]
MKKLKIKTLCLGILSTLIFTSTAMAKTNNVNPNIVNPNRILGYTAPFVKSYAIRGYSDDTRFTAYTNTYSDLYVKNNGYNKVYYFSNDDYATVFLGTEVSSYGTLGGNPYITLDGNEVQEDSVYSQIFSGSLNIVSGGVDVYRFRGIPQGYHTMKSVLASYGFSDSIDLKVNKVSAYNVNDPVAMNTELKFTLPNKVDPSINLNNYVQIFDTTTGNQIQTNATLDSDGQTIIVQSATHQFSANTKYELDILDGMKYTDSTESFDDTIIFFTTNNTVTPPTSFTNNSASKALKSITIDAKNPTKTKNIKAKTNINKNSILTHLKK